MQSVFTCGSVSDGATTNFVNPSYPENDSNAGLSSVRNNVCTFLLKIPDVNEDICQVGVYNNELLLITKCFLSF